MSKVARMDVMDSLVDQIAGCPIGGSGIAPEIVRCEGLSKSFGALKAVDNVDLSLRAGEIAALLGPSGCGKTTLLRLIAGFERPDSGSIEVADSTVACDSNFTSPEKRGVAMVFQDYALFPHMTVEQNVGYALGRRPDRDRVAKVLKMVGLQGLESRRPEELSGGQQQRVALARALAPTPSVVLLDEPFSNLDASMREHVRGEVRQILRAAGVSALLVTHDQEEALSLADTVAVMNNGRIEQVGSPEEVYGQPANHWVASFLGEIDTLPGQASGGLAECSLGTVRVAPELSGEVDILIRPESISVGTGHDGGADAVVVERVYYGHDQLVTLELKDGIRVRSRSLGFPAWHPGDRLQVRLTGPVTALPRA